MSAIPLDTSLCVPELVYFGTASISASMALLLLQLNCESLNSGWVPDNTAVCGSVNFDWVYDDAAVCSASIVCVYMSG